MDLCINPYPYPREKLRVPIPLLQGMDTSRVWVWVRIKLPMGYPCHCYMPVRELRSTSFSVIPHHLSVIPVIPITSPSPLSLYLMYRSLLSIIVSPSFVFRLFLHYRSIPPLSCSEHHFSDLWLHYLTLTSSHSCGWTISLLSS